jgi:hypothetical protein
MDRADAKKAGFFLESKKNHEPVKLRYFDPILSFGPA